MRPRALDLFCGAGGVSKGLHLAGFEVIGVDIKPQPHYPFRFVQADALEFLERMVAGGTWDWIGPGLFSVASASCPCQRFSSMTRRSGSAVVDSHPDLIGPVRELLKAWPWGGIPYVIENVVGAPLIDPVTYCGKTMCPHLEFDGVTRWIKRHRNFESNVPLQAPACTCHHLRDQGHVLGIYGGGTRRVHRRDDGGGNTDKANLEQARALMQIDWMNRRELCQAIPPAYAEHVGRQLRAALSCAP